MFLSLGKKLQAFSEFKKISLIMFVLILYDIFVIKSSPKIFKDIIGGRYAVNYILSIIALTLFVVFLRFLFKSNLISKIIACFVLVVPLALQSIHYSFYNMPVSAYGIRFFLSEPLMTVRLGIENINYFKIFQFSIFCYLLIYLFSLPKIKNKYSKVVLLSISPVYIALIMLCGMNWYLILNFQHSLTSAFAAVPEAARSFYFKRIKANKPEVVLNSTDKKMPNILWIIGESVAKSHMSLYGYTRKTTPNLDTLRDTGNLIPFQNVVSIGPHTLISVPYMLVGRQHIDPEGIIYSSPNIFEYAKERGYHTAFISSQDLRWKNFDQLSGKNVVNFYRAGTDFSSNVSVAKGADDLKVLNLAIIPHLDQIHEPFLMVAHMDGSHYPYNTHSEKQYKKFFPENSPNGTNAYDNTIVYSDIYLSKLIESARKKDPNIWIFYTTDHGQNVPIAKNNAQINLDDEEYKQRLLELEESKKGIFRIWREKISSMFEVKDVNDDESRITFNQGYDVDIIHNAFFVLPPSHYIERIKSIENAPVAQSDIFATILDLMDIQNPVSHIDGLSLLKPIPEDRLRISTGFVVTNDNVPEAQVILSDKSSYFIDFSRKSVSFSKDKSVVKLEDAPLNIQNIFERNTKLKEKTIKSAAL